MTYNNFTTNLSTISTNDYDKFFVKHNKIFITIKKFKNQMLWKFHKYIDCWNSKFANKLSSYKNWNHAINFFSKFKTSTKKTYDLFKNQIMIVKKYIDEMLNKNYIKFNTSKYVISILIVKKSNDELKICVNYKALNAFTIKNRNVFSLIKNILVKLCFVKYYNKFCQNINK